MSEQKRNSEQEEECYNTGLMIFYEYLINPNKMLKFIEELNKSYLKVANKNFIETYLQDCEFKNLNEAKECLIFLKNLYENDRLPSNVPDREILVAVFDKKV